MTIAGGGDSPPPEDEGVVDNNGTARGQLSASASGGTSTAAVQLPHGSSHNASQSDACKGVFLIYVPKFLQAQLAHNDGHTSFSNS